MGWISYPCPSLQKGLEDIKDMLYNWKCIDGTVLDCKKTCKKGKRVFALISGATKEYIVAFLYDYKGGEFYYKDIQISTFEDYCPLPLLRAFNPRTEVDKEWKERVMKCEMERVANKPKQGDIFQVVAKYDIEWGREFAIKNGGTFLVLYKGRKFHLCDANGRMGRYTLRRTTFQMMDKVLIKNIAI